MTKQIQHSSSPPNLIMMLTCVPLQSLSMCGTIINISYRNCKAPIKNCNKNSIGDFLLQPVH